MTKLLHFVSLFEFLAAIAHGSLRIPLYTTSMALDFPLVATVFSGCLAYLMLGSGLDMCFDTNSIRGSNSVDGVCNFESSVPPVFVTSSGYGQTNSAQALKEINRFTRLNADPCSYA